jgi:GTPase SAR1 family protein
VIVVEGPDGAGKTTLAKRICEETNREYRRPPQEVLSSTTGPTPELLDWWHEQLFAPQAVLKEGVFDRCMMISEPIYMAVTRPRPLIQPHQMIGLNRKFVDLAPLIIFCFPGWGEIKKNLQDEDRAQLKGARSLGDHAKILWLYYMAREMYTSLFKATGKGAVLTYDWYNTDEVWPGINSFIAREAEELANQARGINY